MHYRRACVDDCEPGAVLMIRGEFWDVVDVIASEQGPVQVRLLNDFGTKHDISTSTVRSYMLIRHAPRFNVPVLDGRVDQMRRRGIFSNLNAA